MDADEIKHLLRVTGKKQKDLAEYMGRDPAFVTRVLNGTRDLDLPEARQIRAFFQEAQSDLFSAASGATATPIDDYPYAGGFGEESQTPFEAWNVPEHAVTGILKSQSRKLRTLQIGDDGMSETLNRGDEVFIDTEDVDLTQGGIFALMDQGRVLVRRVERVPFSDPPALNLLADNEKARDYTVEADKVQVIGRVCGRLSAI